MKPTEVGLHTGQLSKDTKVVLHCSWAITFFGISSNSLSLYFFIKQVRGRSIQRNMETSATQLFVFLNSFDTLLCIANFLLTLSELTHGTAKVVEVMYTVFFFAEGMTYLITCLLSVRRLINLVWPLYLVKTAGLNIAIAVFCVVELTSGILHYVFPEAFLTLGRIESTIRIVLVFTIVSSSILSFWMLHQSFKEDRHQRTRYATVTIGILSAVFCICNIAPLIALLIAAFHDEGMFFFSDVLFSALTHILIPLNSVCNPVIYITRRSDMRNFFVTKLMRVQQKFGSVSEKSARDNSKSESTIGHRSRTCGTF